MGKKTVLVTKPIHEEALRRLQAEAGALTPYEAGPDRLRALLPGVQGIILGGTFKMGPRELDLAKLDLASRTQAAIYALRMGWASLADQNAF